MLITSDQPTISPQRVVGQVPSGADTPGGAVFHRTVTSDPHLNQRPCLIWFQRSSPRAEKTNRLPTRTVKGRPLAWR